MGFMIIGILPPLYWVEPSGRACVRYHTFLFDDLYFQTNIFCVKDGKFVDTGFWTLQDTLPTLA